MYVNYSAHNGVTVHVLICRGSIYFTQKDSQMKFCNPHAYMSTFTLFQTLPCS